MVRVKTNRLMPTRMIKKLGRRAIAREGRGGPGAAGICDRPL